MYPVVVVWISEYIMYVYILIELNSFEYFVHLSVYQTVRADLCKMQFGYTFAEVIKRFAKMLVYILDMFEMRLALAIEPGSKILHHKI